MLRGSGLGRFGLVVAGVRLGVPRALLLFRLLRLLRLGLLLVLFGRRLLLFGLLLLRLLLLGLLLLRLLLFGLLLFGLLLLGLLLLGLLLLGPLLLGLLAVVGLLVGGERHHPGVGIRHRRDRLRRDVQAAIEQSAEVAAEHRIEQCLERIRRTRRRVRSELLHESGDQRVEHVAHRLDGVHVREGHERHFLARIGEVARVGAVGVALDVRIAQVGEDAERRRQGVGQPHRDLSERGEPHDVQRIRRQVQRLEQRQRRRVQRQIEVERQRFSGGHVTEGSTQLLADLVAESVELEPAQHVGGHQRGGQVVGQRDGVGPRREVRHRLVLVAHVDQDRQHVGPAQVQPQQVGVVPEQAALAGQFGAWVHGVDAEQRCQRTEPGEHAAIGPARIVDQDHREHGQAAEDRIDLAGQRCVVRPARLVREVVDHLLVGHGNRERTEADPDGRDDAGVQKVGDRVGDGVPDLVDELGEVPEQLGETTESQASEESTEKSARILTVQLGEDHVEHAVGPELQVRAAVDLVGDRIRLRRNPTEVDAEHLQHGERRSRRDDVQPWDVQPGQVQRIVEVPPDQRQHTGEGLVGDCGQPDQLEHFGEVFEVQTVEHRPQHWEADGLAEAGQDRREQPGGEVRQQTVHQALWVDARRLRQRGQAEAVDDGTCELVGDGLAGVVDSGAKSTGEVGVGLCVRILSGVGQQLNGGGQIDVVSGRPVRRVGCRLDTDRQRGGSRCGRTDHGHTEPASLLRAVPTCHLTCPFAAYVCCVTAP